MEVTGTESDCKTIIESMIGHRLLAIKITYATKIYKRNDTSSISFT
jgi:hypothetical protein